MKFISIIIVVICIAISLISCNKDESTNEPPYAIFSIDPEQGDTSTVFTFDASGSYNTNEDCNTLRYKWDWEGDGNWDTEYSADKIKEHSYTEKGEYKPKLEIVNCNGWTNWYQKTLDVISPDTTNTK